MKQTMDKLQVLMNKKKYFRYGVIFAGVLILQTVIFNAITYNNREIINSQKLRLDSLNLKVSQLRDQVDENRKQSYVSAHQISGEVIFCDDTLDLSNQHLRESLEREFYSLLSEQGQLHLYIKRSTKYTKMIEKYLAASDLPADLKYLAIHESALLPSIKSRSNAVGLWQFMRPTGRLYGLKINSYIDERRDPEKATIAAMRFLQELYRYYGQWPLVLAAYNGGHGRVQRALQQEKVHSFFDLSLPEETERYYFKIVATKILLENAAVYGINIQDDAAFHPVPSITVSHEIHKDKTYLDEISQQYQMSLAEFKFMNPKFISPYLPAGIYEIYLPVDREHLVMIQKVHDDNGDLKSAEIIDQIISQE